MAGHLQVHTLDAPVLLLQAYIIPIQDRESNLVSVINGLLGVYLHGHVWH